MDNVDEAIFEYYQVFAKQIKPLPPEPQLSDYQRLKKMVNYFLLQWVQALQHMLYTNTLNK